MENRIFNEFLSDFMQHNIVECPNCHQRADVRVLDDLKYKYVNTSTSKITCLHCGYNKTLRNGSHFESLTLFLTTTCSENTLWALNETHLQWLEDYISASHRTRPLSSNQSLASRLPQWLTSAKNRKMVLKGIQKLKAKLKD
ncbi:MAG: hypothetical protein JNL70_08615 [Saprospiraceae bacterium]|nr:hypothetical protein [Saprospiraceae bacterium]